MLRHMLMGGSAVALVTTSAAFAGDTEWFPPDPPHTAIAGECYARVRIEPEYDVYTEQVTTQDSYERYDVTPPRLRPEVREYISREAGMRYIVHEPVYETVTETVQVRPSYVEYVVEPAVHDTVTETIMVREPRMVWRRGYAPGAQMTRFDAETGEVWCLVEEEGEYRTVTRNIVVQPAQIREIEYPAEYATITRDVLVQEARVEQVPIEELRDTYRVPGARPARLGEQPCRAHADRHRHPLFAAHRGALGVAPDGLRGHRPARLQPAVRSGSSPAGGEQPGRAVRPGQYLSLRHRHAGPGRHPFRRGSGGPGVLLDRDAPPRALRRRLDLHGPRHKMDGAGANPRRLSW